MTDPVTIISSLISLIFGIALVGLAVYGYQKLEKTRIVSLIAGSYGFTGIGLSIYALGSLILQPGEELYFLSQRIFYAATILTICCLIAVALALRLGDDAFSPKYTSLIAIVYSLPFLIVLTTQFVGSGLVEIWTTEIFGGNPSQNLFLAADFVLLFINLPLLFAGALLSTFLVYKEITTGQSSEKDLPQLTIVLFALYAITSCIIAPLVITLPILVLPLGGGIIVSFLYIFKWFEISPPSIGASS